MCFTNDNYNWTASETHHEDTVATTGKNRCFDCDLPIQEGEPCRFTEQWEHEQCPDCNRRHTEGDDCEGFDKDEGEHFQMYQCQACLDFRKAIRALEISEGCEEYEAEPNDSLLEEFSNMGDYERINEYVDAGKAMFPQWAEFFDARYGRRNDE